MARRAIGPGSLVASRFRLEDLLEENSGARFWRATDLTLARNVAVHVISRDDPRATAVLTAARTSATVSDPRILRVLDAVEEEELVHVVHEWGSGLSLDRLLSGELLEPRRAAWLVREVAQAIEVAHRHGIAHGRLLPENVLVTDVGSVKLIGFVVDAVLHGRSQPPGATGLPPSEHESDVLNLGALLYACLTGKWAGFPASSLAPAPYDHDRVCRPRQVRQGVPKQLDALCDQVLNPGPKGARRFESAAQVRAALDDYLGDAVGGAVDVSDATAFVDPDALRSPGDSDTAGQRERSPADGSSAADGEATQPGLAPVPSAWGGERRPGSDPDATRPALPRPAAPISAPQPAERSRPGWVRVAVVLGVLALLAAAVFVGSRLDLGGDGDGRRGNGPSSPDAKAPGQVIEPASVDDFDPDGEPVPEENSAMVPLATDGKPATAWETKTYFDGPVLAPYRSGVGLLLDLGKVKPVGSVTVTLQGGPYDVALLAAPPRAERPTTTDGLKSVEARSGVSGEVELRGDDRVRARYLVVWLTSLPRSTDGYRGGIAEIAVRS